MRYFPTESPKERKRSKKDHTAIRVSFIAVFLNRYIFLLILPSLLFAGNVSGQQSTISDADRQRLARAFAEIDASLKASGPETGPGCSYAAAKRGQVLFSRSYGMAELEHDVPVTEKTVFNAASVAKQFTAAAILLLVQDGKLQLSDDARKYLPEMPNYGTPITIRNLLNHTSGLREWSTVEELSGRPLFWRFHENADVLQVASRQNSLNHAPGERLSYTNTGYILLAIILERVSGKSLAEFTSERLFKPYGMKLTRWTNDLRQVVKHRATGYYKPAVQTGDSPYVRAVLTIGNVYGSGGLLTTVGDLLLWNNVLDSGRLGGFITNELQRKTVLNDGRSVSYGAGLYLLNYKDHEWIWHSGGTNGFRSTLDRFPQSGLSIAVLCNSDHAQARLISSKIADALLPETVSQPEPTKTENLIALTTEQLARFTGLFIIEQTGFPVMITAENGKLVVDKEPMETVNENLFRSPGPWGELVFKTPDLAERVVKTEPDGLQTLRRVNGTIPLEKQLAEFTGRYISDEAEGSYTIVVDKDTLMLKGSDLNGRKFGPSFSIRPIARDLFQISNRMIRFNRDPEGKVTSFDFTTERVRALRFNRLQPRLGT